VALLQDALRCNVVDCDVSIERSRPHHL
jgi:hypothetical protein